MLLSFSLVHHFPLISWLWKKWIENSNYLPKVKISKWKSSTKLIADTFRILSALLPYRIKYVIQSVPCFELWITASELPMHTCSCSFLWSIYFLLQICPREVAEPGQRWCHCCGYIWGFLSPPRIQSCKTEERLGTLSPTLCLSRYSQVTSKRAPV